MVSLLFIANSPAVDGAKTALHQLLKIRIDIVSDFDHGLKDVFEKRPSIVCIQEQIQGVTGESVARHIQMLLGNSAPLFILLHDSNPRIKPIKGLFDHLIDLNQASDKVLADMLVALKSLLGSQWQSIYIAPKGESASDRAASIVPVESKDFADQLVDDLISDLDSFGPADNKLAELEGLKHSEDNLTTEERISILTEQSNLAQLSDLQGNSNTDETLPVVSPATEYADLNPPVFSVTETLQPVEPANPVMPFEKNALTDLTPAIPHVDSVTKSSEVPQKSQPVLAKENPVPQKAVKTISDNTIKSTPETFETIVQPTETKDTDIKISKLESFTIPKQKPDLEEIPEDLLIEFERNFRSQSASRKKIGIFLLIGFVSIGIAGWYANSKKPDLFFFLTNKKVMPAKNVVVTKPEAVTVAGSPAAQVQKHHSSNQVPLPQPIKKQAITNLPSFIPEKGIDQAYSEKKPGWSRYVGSTEEFRLFRVEGKIKALQVLSRNGESIPESRFTSIVKEIAGNNGQYNVVSSEKKLGFKVSKGIVSGSSEILVYRKKGTVRAFVISLN